MAECVIRAGARLNLGLSMLAENIAAHDYMLHEPAESPASWVDEVASQVHLLKDRLQQIPSLEVAFSSQV